MSSGLGAKTSKTNRPPGSSSSRAALSARSFSSSSAMCSSVRNGQIDERDTLVDRGCDQVADAQVDEMADAGGRSGLAGDGEHARRGVHTDDPDARLRDRDRDAARSDGQLDDGAAAPRRMLDVEADVLGDRPAPRVVDPGDRVVQRHTRRSRARGSDARDRGHGRDRVGERARTLRFNQGTDCSRPSVLQMAEARDPAAIAALLVGAVLAGGNAVGVRFSNRELDPLWGAGLRFTLAAALLGALMLALRLELPRGRALAGAVAFGALNFGAAFGLAYYGFVRVHAGLGQTIVALVPLMTLLLAVAQRQERLHVRALVGAVVALVGVALMSRAPLHEGVPLASVLALVGGALCLAQAAVLARWIPRVHPVTMNAVGMTAGAIVLLLASLVAGEELDAPERTATWAAIAYTVVFGSVVVFVLYVFLLGRWVASRAAYGFVLIPIVTVVLSAWLDDEPIGAGLVLGGSLVLAGVYVGAIRPTREPEDVATAAPVP